MTAGIDETVLSKPQIQGELFMDTDRRACAAIAALEHDRQQRYFQTIRCQPSIFGDRRKTDCVRVYLFESPQGAFEMIDVADESEAKALVSRLGACRWEDKSAVFEA